MSVTTVRPTLRGITAASFTQAIADRRVIAALDPLGMDWLFVWSVLPLINAIPMWAAAIRIWLLKLVAVRFVPADFKIKEMTELEAMAATRDLGMIAASLRRCGKEPGFVPVLEAALLSLAAVTGEGPGETVWHYGGPWNPADCRRTRRFTLWPKERLFIRDIQTGMELLPRAVDLICDAARLGINSPLYAGLLEEAHKCLEPMVAAIHASMLNISPEFFTYRLRPFFEPKLIGDRFYKAAGAAQMPIIWIDLLLWAMEGSPWPFRDYGLNRWSYWDYFEENLAYQPRCLRERVEGLVGLESLLGNARRELAEGGLNDVAIRSLVALHAIFEVMLHFRGPHLVVAKKNMKLRPKGSRGSGGYQSNLLVFLLDQVKNGRIEIRRMLPARSWQRANK